ncbi:hypothetical protein BDV28DRAFT_148685 [Aspergillus coremiiformis]|uniref:Uncharacterized protein n=1 Tax=Aspergillus coremiiformis TaxID=138285 RepID=A0A5N6Z7E7_9EURO|nr:hypothetical protein BDV28DRAFT_148685 [Aspergillus coremiiformis]
MTTGFAVRKNSSCLQTETNCGETVRGFRGCCPGGTYCPHAYNIDCCPAGINCTASLVKEPRCANATWDLYDNAGYYYCCPHGTIGFALDGFYDGCAGPGYSFGNGDAVLKIVSSGSATLLATTSTTSESSSTSTTTALATPSSSPLGLNKGAFAGGLTGGLVGVALLAAFLWLFRRRRSRPQLVPMHEADVPITDSRYMLHLPAEMDGRGHLHELESHPQQPVNELPAQFPGR